ncbi:hypothetical protein FM21_18185 [Streptomyces mutabilis]|uniref:Uncharacterized protein n=1 Tax=Streptomyces mutabilis TaxID=67332 RepID=A0A086MV89_9ACTN|nr:hypothetical protein FM21_18185 [Streptomyces mutabilis]
MSAAQQIPSVQGQPQMTCRIDLFLRPAIGQYGPHRCAFGVAHQRVGRMPVGAFTRGDSGYG